MTDVTIRVNGELRTASVPPESRKDEVVPVPWIAEVPASSVKEVRLMPELTVRSSSRTRLPAVALAPLTTMLGLLATFTRTLWLPVGTPADQLPAVFHK